MKYFPFKILILCILMPPILYIASVQVLENQLQSRYSHEIEEIYIGDTKRVPIKRKVFGKKNRETVFEVLFSYKGRLYYCYTQGQKPEVVAIGTKRTQTKDLAFIDQL